MTKVDEFRFIREEAKKLGVKVYLFGGTAAGFAHYVKWSVQQEGGDGTYQKERFDFDYTNIFRSTQDADLVVDGAPEKAEALERLIQQKYNHLQGSKSAWEVRLLREKRGDKEPLLDNPDFLNQHTDSHSTGLIDITDGSVHDLRDWKSSRPNFLEDVAEGKLHYYFSDKHGSTSRAKQGMNPPIVSAIRYLTKAFQYELEMRPEDLALVTRVIGEFDETKELDSYVAKWIEKNGKKLYQNAVNLENARKILDRVGLRKKLIALGDPAAAESLAWWMSKEPLPSLAVGKGGGRTAGELKLSTLAHETSSFAAYESITLSHQGDPNVFLSRDGAKGEQASFGDGFYTMSGRKGAKNTGLTIRFTLDPAAREGHDFKLYGDIVLVLNKAAIRVIPESLNLGPVEYFEMLAKGNEISADDRGILEKLRRRLSHKINADPAVLTKIAAVVRRELRKKSPSEALLSEWFSIPDSRRDPELAKVLVEYFKLVASGKTGAGLLKSLRNGPPTEVADSAIQEILKIVRKELTKKKVSPSLVSEWLALSESWKYPEIGNALIRDHTGDPAIRNVLFTDFFTRPEAAGHPQLGTFLKAYLADTKHDRMDGYTMIQRYLCLPHVMALKEFPELLEIVVKNKKVFGGEAIVQSVLSDPRWATHPVGAHIVELILKQGSLPATYDIVEQVLSNPAWAANPRAAAIVEKIVRFHLKESFRSPILDLLDGNVFRHKAWQENPDLKAAAGGGEVSGEALVRALRKLDSGVPCPGMFGKLAGKG